MDKIFRSFRSLGEAANFPHETPTTGYRFEQNALILFPRRHRLDRLARLGLD